MKKLSIKKPIQWLKSLTIHKILYGQYSWSETNSVATFNPNKYADRMKIENTQYVYDKIGRIIGMVCAPTKAKAVRQCKKYIIKKRLRIIELTHYINSLKQKK
jgi:hypothetical protein